MFATFKSVAKSVFLYWGCFGQYAFDVVLFLHISVVNGQSSTLSYISHHVCGHICISHMLLYPPPSPKSGHPHLSYHTPVPRHRQQNLILNSVQNLRAL